MWLKPSPKPVLTAGLRLYPCGAACPEHGMDIGLCRISVTVSSQTNRRGAPAGQPLPPRPHGPGPAFRSSPAPTARLPRQTQRPFPPVQSMGHLAVGSQIAAGTRTPRPRRDCRAGVGLHARSGDPALGCARLDSSGVALLHLTRSWSLDLQESYQKCNRPWH